MTDFFGTLGNDGKRDEMVTGIEVTRIGESTNQAFYKFTLRRPVDFAIVSVAPVLAVEAGICSNARIALGAVAPGPVRARGAKEVLKGGSIGQQAAMEAAEEAVGDAKPPGMNAYKIEITRRLVEEAILAQDNYPLQIYSDINIHISICSFSQHK